MAENAARSDKRKFKVVRLDKSPKAAQINEFVGMMTRMYDFHATLHPDWQTRPGWQEGSTGWVKRAGGGDDFLFAMAYPLDEAGQDTLESAAGYLIASFHYEAPLFLQHRFGYIADLWVEEAYRGQGAAQKLLETANEWFHEQGVSRVQLEVDVENTGGRQFWESQGYTPFEIVMRSDLQTKPDP